MQQPSVDTILPNLASLNQYEAIIWRLKSIWRPDCPDAEAYEVIRECIDPNCTLIGFHPGQVLTGPQGFYAFYKTWKASLTGFGWSRVEIASKGNVCFGFSTGEGLFQNDFLGLKATQKRAPLHFNARYVINADMKVAHMLVCSTMLNWLIDVGVPLGVPLQPLAVERVPLPQLAEGQVPYQQQQQMKTTTLAPQTGVPLQQQPQQQQFPAGIAQQQATTGYSSTGQFGGTGTGFSR